MNNAVIELSKEGAFYIRHGTIILNGETIKIVPETEKVEKNGGQSMKPIIIFSQKDENGNICMSAEKFEKYIQMAYESGVEEGSKSSITTMRGSDLSCVNTASKRAVEAVQHCVRNTMNYQS